MVTRSANDKAFGHAVHPVWAVTWKTGQAGNPQDRNFDQYRMDVRGPYGSLNFDGAENRNEGDAVGGVAWGDFGLKFTTTDAQLTLNSPWTYNSRNTVCFTQAWTAKKNAEMGIVQTRVADKEMGYQDRVVGRERGHTSAEDYLNKGNCTGFGEDNRNYSIPCVSGWPYQLMNSDWDPGSGKPAADPTGTKLIAWGSPYGWLGASSFNWSWASLGKPPDTETGMRFAQRKFLHASALSAPGACLCGEIVHSRRWTDEFDTRLFDTREAAFASNAA